MNKLYRQTYCLLALTISLCFITACGSSSENKKQAQSSNKEQKKAKAQAVSFNADSAYHFVEEQVAFGYRLPNSREHKACGDWIVNKLISWGYATHEQIFQGTDYHGKSITGRNIIASLNPEATNRILLLAHYDTRAVADHDPQLKQRNKAILGADDGGSGVAVLLELARSAKARQSDLGLDFLFVDLEDGGQGGSDDGWCQGSIYWAKQPHKADYKAKCAILLDMVGGQNAKFCWEAYSKVYAAPYLYAIWDTALKLGWGSYFLNKEVGGLVDDHVSIIKGRKIPALDIVNYDDARENGFGNHWHTQNDNMSIIRKETLQAVGETVGTALETKLK